MSLIATLALAASAGATLPQCSWDRPGVNPFMGDVVAAVDRYTDIPAATRDKLKARMKARQYDEIAVIERDGIRGKASYSPEIRDMHFGQGSVCRTVTRVKWTATTQERGLVYCEDGQCVLVPTVCRNVSRITRTGKPVAVAPASASNVASSARDGGDEAAAPLEFEAPGAGPLAAAAPGSFAQGAGVPSLGGEGLGAGSGGLPGGASPNPVTAQGSGGIPPTIDLGLPPLPPGVTTAATTPNLPTDTPGVQPPGTIDLPGLPGLPNGTPGLPAEVPAIPEPGTWALLAAGLAALAYRARRSSGAK